MSSYLDLTTIVATCNIILVLLLKFYRYRKISNIHPSRLREVTMGRRIDPSWGGPIELFLVPVSAPRLV